MDIKKLIEDRLKKLEEESNKPSPFPMLPDEKYNVIKKKLGCSGCMLSGSKRAPKNKEGKEHLVVWNANLLLPTYGKVWFGDIDITKSESILKEIALALDTEVYILREMDARFGKENNPDFSLAVYKTDGKTSTINKQYEQYYERDKKGNLLTKEIVSRD